MNSIYDEDELFRTLEQLVVKTNEENGSLENLNVYTFKMAEDDAECEKKISISKINEENVEYGKKISIVIHEDNSEFLTFCMTKYDKFEFKEKVHQPFLWDGDAAERFSQGEWIHFLADKGLINEFEISIIKDCKTLTAHRLERDNEFEVDGILLSIGFNDLVHSTLYAAIDKPKNKKPRM